MFTEHVLWAVLRSLLKWYYLMLTTCQRSRCVSWEFFGWKLQRRNSNWLNQIGNRVSRRSGKMGTSSLRQSCVQGPQLGQQSSLSPCLSVSLYLCSLNFSFQEDPSLLSWMDFFERKQEEKWDSYHWQLQSPIVPLGDSRGKRDLPLCQRVSHVCVSNPRKVSD